MQSRIFISVGFGLLVSGGTVCWVAWDAMDHFALLAGAFGIGLGAAMMYQGQAEF